MNSYLPKPNYNFMVFGTMFESSVFLPIVDIDLSQATYE